MDPILISAILAHGPISSMTVRAVHETVKPTKITFPVPKCTDIPIVCSLLASRFRPQVTKWNRPAQARLHSVAIGAKSPYSPVQSRAQQRAGLDGPSERFGGEVFSVRVNSMVEAATAKVAAGVVELEVRQNLTAPGPAVSISPSGPKRGSEMPAPNRPAGCRRARARPGSGSLCAVRDPPQLVRFGSILRPG